MLQDLSSHVFSSIKHVWATGQQQVKKNWFWTFGGVFAELFKLINILPSVQDTAESTAQTYL